MPRVSFLVPLYNAAQDAPDAIRSLLAQSERDLEVVAVDDGSSDETPAILAELARTDGRVRPLSVPHGGIVHALNAGLQCCTAPVIARLDADDRALPARAAQQLALLAQDPTLAGVGSLVELRADTREESIDGGMSHYLQWTNTLIVPQTIAAARFIESPVVHTSLAIRAEVLRELGGYREAPTPEDYDLFLRMLNRGLRLAKVNDVGVTIGDRPERLTRIDPRCSRDAFHACRLHHLLTGPLAGHGECLLWGAGKTGKRWLADLATGGCPVRYVGDSNPQRVGKTIRGAEVVTPDALAAHYLRAREGGAVAPPILVAIAARGAHAQVRSWAESHGLCEGRDFFALAGMAR